MKKLGKILLGLVLFCVVVLICAQIFGVKYLKKTVDKFVLPQVEEITGVDVAIKNLSLNLFKGIVNVEGVVLGNPEGYDGDLLTIGEFKTDLRMKALFKKEVYINELKLKDVHLAVMAKDAKNLNVLDLANHISAEKAKETSGKDNKNKTSKKSDTVVSADEEVSTKTTEPVDFKLQNSAFNFLFSFILVPGDYIKKEYSLDWNLILEARNITNMESESSPGSLNIQSGNARKDSEPQVYIDCIIYPLTDMSKPSFAAHGTIASFNMLEIEEWCEKLGVGSSNLDLKLNMVCEKGLYTEASNIEFIFKNPKLYGSLANQAGSVKLPDIIKVIVPVKGSWDDPEVDLKPALTKVVFEVTKSTLINKYVPEEYKDAAQEAGKSISEGLNSLFGGDKKKK